MHSFVLPLIRPIGSGSKKRDKEKKSPCYQALTSTTISSSFWVMLMWVVKKKPQLGRGGAFRKHVHILLFTLVEQTILLDYNVNSDLCIDILVAFIFSLNSSSSHFPPLVSAISTTSHNTQASVEFVSEWLFPSPITSLSIFCFFSKAFPSILSRLFAAFSPSFLSIFPLLSSS